MRLRIIGMSALGLCAAAFAAVTPLMPSDSGLAAPPAQAGEAASAISLSDGKPESLRRLALAPADAKRAAEMRLLPEGTRSLLVTGGQLTHGEYLWDETNVPDGELVVWVDLRRQMLSVFRGGHEIGTAVIVYGSPDKKTPIGTFPIRRKYRDYHSRTYDAPMPFSMFITNDGVALHGSRMVPIRATHGCVGLPNEFAEKLFEQAETGDLVSIVESHSGASGRTALAGNS